MVAKKRVKVKEKIHRDLQGFYRGLFLFIVFLALYLVTLPGPEPIPKSFEEMNVTERIEYVEEQRTVILDDSDYLRAISSNNNVYCGRINDESLRKKCYEEVTEYAELVPDTRSEQDLLDDSNYLRAVSSGDVSYCDRIIDVDKKQECYSVLSGEDEEEYFEESENFLEEEEYFEEE